MSFISRKFDKLTPYTPGEQPKDRKYIKLNTNESPYPPSEKAVKYACEASENVMLYSDPQCTELRKALAKQYDNTIHYIEKQRLEQWVHNKTIQKAIESYRITEEQKSHLKSLRWK